MRKRRWKKLIKPEIQLRMVVAFLGIACLSTLVQAIMLNWTFRNLVSTLPHDELIVLSTWPTLLRSNVLFTLAFLAPLTLCVGILTTFRFAGPVHRIEMFLRQVIDREQPGELGLRKGDQLKDLCDLLNRAVAVLQEGEGVASSDPVGESGSSDGESNRMRSVA